MVLAFFRHSSGQGSLDHVVTKSISMLADARHSFDLATLVVLSDADAASVAQDVRDTDRRINVTEQELRSELVVHVSVQGGADIGTVLGFTLLLKKIERIGDQAKNILELAEHGVSFAGHADVEAMLAERQEMSEVFAAAGEMLADADSSAEAMEAFERRVDAIINAHQQKIDSYMDSDRPGREVVPLAIYYRYLRRIAANLLGIVRTADTPIQPADDLASDIDD